MKKESDLVLDSIQVIFDKEDFKKRLIKELNNTPLLKAGQKCVKSIWCTDTPVDLTGFEKSFVVFTNPRLNLLNDKNLVNQSIIDKYPSLYLTIMSFYDVVEVLQPKGLRNGVLENIPYVPLLSNMYLSVKNTDDENLLEINFFDTREDDVNALLEIWTQYTKGVFNGDIEKGNKINDTEDYETEAHIFTVDESDNIKCEVIKIHPESVSTYKEEEDHLYMKLDGITTEDDEEIARRAALLYEYINYIAEYELGITLKENSYGINYGKRDELNKTNYFVFLFISHELDRYKKTQFDELIKEKARELFVKNEPKIYHSGCRMN